MKVIPKTKVIYTFSPHHKPVAQIKPQELVLLQTQDALGGQIQTEKDSLDNLDWTKVNGSTGPLYIENAQPGDTLIAEILDIKTEQKGVILIVPKHGVLGHKSYKPATKIVKVNKDYIHFNNTRIKTNPMIGTIGVAPKDKEIPTGTPDRHGGNMDVKELTAGTRLYLPIFTEGALFAAGDLHATQADGELCVSSIEVAGQILLRFNLIKNKQPKWPILETHDHYSILASGPTLDEAATNAAETATEALMREHNWPFEKAYMLGSLVVDLKINQAVDPKKGVRAVIPKNHITLNSLLTQNNQ